MGTPMDFFDSYCYGPVDITGIRRKEQNLLLSLQDPAGKNARALYEDCVFAPPPSLRIGLHLSLVQQFTARQLLRQSRLDAIKIFQLCGPSLSAALEQWEQNGFSFFLHTGNFSGSEFLVVAKGLDYREANERA